MRRVRMMAACIAAALLAAAPVSAHVRDFGFYSVHGRSHGMDYIDEVRGKANMIVWSYDDLTLDTDFPQRIAAAPKLRLLLTLPLTTATDYTSGINAAVFANNPAGARLTYLNHVKNRIQNTNPPLINAVPYIAISEEWYTLMYQGYFGPSGLNWNLFNGDNWQNRDLMKSYLESFISDVKSVFPGIPVVLVDGWWSDSPYNLNNAPSNVDVLGLDAYFIPTSGACDSTQRARFDSQVTAAYDAAASYNKPFIMVASSSPYNGPMPSPCQLQWYKDLADSRPSIQGLMWWLYGTTDGQPGVREYPTEKSYLFQMGQQVLSNNTLVIIDAPAPNSTTGVNAPLFIGGWAVDRSARLSAGIGVVHVWAWPVAGGPPIWAGASEMYCCRPDVAAYLGGSQFTNSGYALHADSGVTSTSGTYDLVVYPLSTETGQFEFSRVAIVRVTIQ
jgi:hypothetical protein